MAATTIDELQVQITAITSDFSKQMKEVRGDLQGVDKQSGSTGRAISSLAKIGAVAAAAIGAAFVAGSVKAVKSFAEYEQLVGGVETLFKDSSKQVLAYANNAYKTAGLSANAYMETVTSFSASLLQGLGGDTKKATEYANMAVTDMSDNANKMGTSIELIQNSYQGFAKDNYTMLDNLKLGYGGTASEMARLVNESGVMGKSFKATAENVSEIPFDKVIEAIHKTQVEMGIAGTTAKEAGDTITGSWNAVNASLENVFTGIEGSGKALGESLLNLFGQLIVKVPKIVSSMVSGMYSALDTMVKTIDWDAVYKKIVPSEAIRKTIGESIAKVFEFTDLLNGGNLMEAGKQLGTSVGGGITAAIQGLRLSMETIKAWFASINWGEVGIAVGTGALAFVAGLVIGLFSTESLMQFVGFIADNWVAVLLTVAGIAFAPAKLLAPIGKLFGTVISKLPFGPQFVSAFGKIVDVIRGFFEPIRSAFHSTFVAPLIGSASNVVKGITTVINAIKDILLTPFRLGVQAVVNVIQGIPKAVSAVITIVRSLFAPLAEYIGGLFRVGVANARNALSPLVNFVGGIVSGIKGRFADIVGWFSSKFNSIKNTISNINWGDVGANMMRGIGDGIGRMGGYLADRAKAAVGSAKDALKSFLGIHSPSRVMRDEVGKMMGLGVALGIDQSTKDAVKSARNSAKSVLGAYGGSFNTNLPSSSQLSGNLGVSIASMPEPSGRATPVNVQIDGNTLLSFVIDGVNNKAFMTNSSVIDY